MKRVMVLALAVAWGIASADAGDAGLAERVRVLERAVAALQTQSATLTRLLNNSLLNGKLTLSSDGSTVVFTGVNVQVVDGSGRTDSSSGLGNLVVGYNAGGSGAGSHNIVVGDFNSYPSYGGLVTGSFNGILAPYAVVIGGYENNAKGAGSTIISGSYNGTSGQNSGIVGGQNNFADGRNSVASGGYFNRAKGDISSVTGGINNLASGAGSSMTGGEDGQANGALSSVVGGNGGRANGGHATVTGGDGNQAIGDWSTVSGGFGVQESTPEGWAAGSTGQGAFHSP